MLDIIKLSMMILVEACKVEATRKQCRYDEYAGGLIRRECCTCAVRGYGKNDEELPCEVDLAIDEDSRIPFIKIQQRLSVHKLEYTSTTQNCI